MADTPSTATEALTRIANDAYAMYAAARAVASDLRREGKRADGDLTEKLICDLPVESAARLYGIIRKVSEMSRG